MSMVNRKLSVKKAFNKFNRCESGGVTVEFVVVLPSFLLFILGMIVTSLLIATISDVQQLASDMTRQSLTYVYDTPSEEQLCEKLEQNVQPMIASQLVFLNGENISDINCQLASDGRSSTVSVTYDLKNMVFMNFLSDLGWSKTTVTRQAVLML
ncbi:TadE/TadG family type IV pilus assembly protein [Paramylibacter ulvae]|nr:TadE family protein [Amylibacter ulvae]